MNAPRKASKATSSVEPESGVHRVAQVIDFAARRDAKEEERAPMYSTLRAVRLLRLDMASLRANPVLKWLEVCDSARSQAYGALNAVRGDTYKNPAAASALIRQFEDELANTSNELAEYDHLRPNRALVVSLRARRRARAWPITKPWEALKLPELAMWCLAAHESRDVAESDAYRAAGFGQAAKRGRMRPWDERHNRMLESRGLLADVRETLPSGRPLRHMTITDAGRDALADADGKVTS